MKLTNHGPVPVYTISGSSTARPLPEWLARKRKRSLKQDPEYANRIELLQDFEFEEASSCIRVSDDGDWVMSTGTYKPQIHVHYLPHLSLSFSRHTNALNQTFILLSSDYSKSLHLQTDRFLEFHTPTGCHHTTRIPRYGRDLKYDKRTAEALITSTGVDYASQMGEVYRLNLEIGRFMKPYAVDVGGDDFTSLGGGALQGGINTGSVNTAAVAEDSHNLLAFGTSLGTVEFWDSRSRNRVGLLQAPRGLTETSYTGELSRAEITATEFHHSGLTFATGSSNGLVHLYDLRSPAPLLRKDQGYGYPVHTVKFLSTASKQSSYTSTTSPLILSADKRIIKIWDQTTGSPWTHVEAAVDLNSIAWCPNTGMLLTANEGRQQHSFFIPQLGPAPRWCSFLDNLVEEMAEDGSDPNAYKATGSEATSRGGEVYDNYKFVTVQDLRALNLEEKIGTALLKPYMHGYFMRQELYEEARILAQPDLWAEQRQRSIREKIEKERESRIRGTKKAANAKVNRKLAEKMLEREEKNERRKARRALRKDGTADADADADDEEARQVDDIPMHDEKEDELAGKGAPVETERNRNGLLDDPRFASLFQDEDFEIDETSYEFRALNPSTATDAQDSTSRPRGLTAVEQELQDQEDALQRRRKNRGALSSDDSASESGSEDQGSADDGGAKPMPNGNTSKDISYRRSAKRNSGQRDKDDGRGRNQRVRNDRRRPPQGLQMHVSSSSAGAGNDIARRRDKSFGDRVQGLNGAGAVKSSNPSQVSGRVVGGKEVKFTPVSKRSDGASSNHGDNGSRGGGGRDWKARRSASGNTFRNL